MGCGPARPRADVTPRGRPVAGLTGNVKAWDCNAQCLVTRAFVAADPDGAVLRDTSGRGLELHVDEPHGDEPWRPIAHL
jgi:hypothetical protein